MLASTSRIALKRLPVSFNATKSLPVPFNATKGLRWQTTFASPSWERPRPLIVEANDALREASHSFTQALSIATRMKADGLSPNLQTYELLMTAAANGAFFDYAWAIYEDMQAMGIKPTTYLFESFIAAAREKDAREAWRIMDEMKAHDIPPTTDIWRNIISPYLASRNLEMTLRIFKIIIDSGCQLDLDMVNRIVNLAAHMGNPQIALDIAMSFERETVRQLPESAWLQCLEACTDALNADGTELCWTKITRDFAIFPGEGVCMDVLHTAGRNGRPDLATDVLKTLREQRIAFTESHFAPLLESYCRAGRVKDAIEALSLMRANNVETTTSTALPILSVSDVNPETFDATFALIEEIHKEGKKVDIAALHVMLRAAATLGDLPRAVGTYESFVEFSVVPMHETYEILLDACIQVSHFALGTKLTEEMASRNLATTPVISENMALLSLTQETFEEAFGYLEDSKVSGARVPSITLYEAFARKLALVNDPRLPILLAEMKQFEIEIPEQLQKDLKLAAEQWRGQLAV